MSFLNGILQFVKKLTIFILVVSIAIPLFYGSTNPKYIGFHILHSILSLKHSLISDPIRPMLSAEYRAFENILRMKPLAKRDPLVDSLTLIKEVRLSFTLDTLIPKPSQCQIDREVFEYNEHTVDAYWINYPSKNSDKILIYTHGGGYIMGDIHGYSGIECHLSKLFNVSVLHVEYRLSPEYPLPAAVEDMFVVYRALLRNNISSSQIIIMGESAGGGLALLTIQSLLTHQIPVPHGVIVMSPWTDLSASGESHIRNLETDIMFNTDDIKWITSQALGSNHSQLSADSSIFSPLFGSFEGFPSMYITVGTAELLEDDARRVVKKAQEANVNVTFEEGLYLMHGYPLFFPYYPEARHTLDNINKWIQILFDQKKFNE